MSTSHLDLDIKVRDIVNSYRSVNILHPVVSESFQSPGFPEIFWRSFNQDLHVVCQRSQILVHGEVTAIQKAFAVLMKKEDLIPAVELYVNEILGLKFVPEPDRSATLNAMIQTRHLILDQAYGSKHDQSSLAANRALASSSQSALSDHKPPSESLFISDGSEGSPTPNLPHIAGEQDDQKFKRLFIIYDRARKDFEATPAKTLERTKSAKFLRDTTENCLAYIAAKQNQPGAKVTCDVLLLELQSTLEETIAIAEQGSGGKKRRFDENWENIPQEPAKMRGPGPSVAQPSGYSGPVPRGQTSEKKRRPIPPRIQKHQVSPEPDYRQQRIDLAERRRSDRPHQLYPPSTHQSARRGFGDRNRTHEERQPFHGRVFGDRYRPRYK